MKSASDDPLTFGLWDGALPWCLGQNIKSAPGNPLKPGNFVRPAGAQLRSAFDEASLNRIWEEVGECLAYPKPDGWRIQIHKKGEEVTLFSRSEKTWTKEYRSIADMIRTRVKDDQVILDTELVGFDAHGRHRAPSKLRYAFQYRCYLLDALYLSGRDLRSLPTRERVPFIQMHFQDVFGGVFLLAEYTHLHSLEGLIDFYQQCLSKRKEGFDGVILKRLDAPYFTEVLKLKPEDTVDAVVIGAYKDGKGVVQSLLLALPSPELKLWVPVAKATRTNTDWDVIWTACQPFIVDHRPSYLDEIPEIPDIWITPHVVVEITMTELHPGKGYIVRAEYPRKCTLREDKGCEDATSLEQILQIAGLTEIIKALSERAKRPQLYLFEEYDSVIGEHIFDEHKEAGEVTSFKEILPVEDLMPQANLLNKSLIQLSLFEQ